MDGLMAFVVRSAGYGDRVVTAVLQREYLREAASTASGDAYILGFACVVLMGVLVHNLCVLVARELGPDVLEDDD